jgi:hypothetical protein
MKRIASQLLVIGLSYLLCVPINAQQQAVQQQIVPDGKTNTTVKVNGKTTDVTTSTVQGTVAYNSFSTFNVAKGNTVDLVLPSGSLDLLNLVNSQAINIWGVLNSIQNGKIGGNVLFADPFGMVVGKSGSVNVGALMLITPTKAFMDSLFTAGAPSAANTSALLSGAVPISSDGMILVQGRINTISDAVLVGQNVTNSGKIASGAVFASSQPDFSDVVNVNGLVAGNALSTQNGNIEIVAQGDFQNSGQIRTDGANNLDAGNISIQAGNDVTLSSGSLISASGEGQNSNGGGIKIWASHDAEFDQGAVIAARGGNVSGSGGAIELSAKDTVKLAGGAFNGGATDGKNGSVLVDPTDTDVAVNTPTGGADYTNTGDTFEVEPGVTIGTQNSTAGGNSGNISINETTSINIKGGATLDASATGGGTAGNVSLAVNNSVSKSWSSGSTNDNTFNTTQANASITIGSGAVIKGQDISLSATATDSKTATISETADGSRTAAPDGLCVLFGSSGSCGSNTSALSITDSILGLLNANSYAGGILSQATANIQMGGNITATGKVTIDSEASSTAKFTANGLYITYAESDATAMAQVLSGANITATGDVDVTAHSTNNLTNTGKAVAGQSNNSNTVTQTGPAVVFVYSDGSSKSIAGLEQGSTVNAANVNLLAKNENSFQTQAQPSVNGDGSSTQQYGAGAALAISNTNSSTDSHINGTVTATAAVTSDAESLDNKKETDATAVVKNSNSDDNSSNTSSANSKVTGSSNAVEIGAGVAIANDSNTASSTVGPNAVINATGNVTIEANASDKFKEDVSGSADTASTISAGGAVAIADYTNTATASVDQNADVTSGGTVDVKATAEMPNDLAADLIDVEQFLENFSVSGSVSDLKTFLGNSTSSVSGLQSAYNSIKTAYKNLTDGTTTSVSSTGQPGGGGVGVAGVVTALTANNTATAFVDQGATVKSTAATVEASATTQSTNDAGTSTAQNSKDSTQNNTGSSSPLGSFGGTYAGITYNDTATAYIADGATVNTSGGDLNVTSTANNFMANLVAAGQSSGGTLGVSGAISDVTINSKSTAYIEDQAQVNVTGNVKVDAENTTRAYQIADDTNSAQTVSIGATVGSLNINDTTDAFIGDNGTPTGYPIGQVTATGNVTVTADNLDRLMALAASSVKNSNGKTNSGGANGNGKMPSSGSSNGTNNTSDSNPQTNAGGYNFGIGVSGDVAFNNITDVTKGYISNGVTVNAAATTVSAQDQTLVVAADGGLVRSSTAGLQGSLADNSITKTTEAYTNGVTIDTGSLSVTSNSSDIVLALSAGGAGDSSSSSQVASLAGSAVDNNITNNTTASVDNSTVAGTAGGVTPTGAVTISATNRDTGYSVAGAFDYSSGDVGVGVSLDIGVLDNTVTARVGTGSNINSNNNVQVTSSDDENQLAVSADLASSADFSVAASIAYQKLTKDVEAYIADGATVKTTGGTTHDISVNANDDQGGSSLGLPSGLIQIAGTFADGSDVGLGAAGSVSTTTKTVTASIGNSSNVTASGDVDVAALTSDNLYLFAGGGAIGETAGFMGSAIFNNVNNNTSAAIGSSTVSANNVNVNANDTLNVVDAAGGYSGSSTASVGAGGDLEFIGTLGNPQTVSASIGSGANVTAANNVNVTAKQTQTAVSVAADAGFGGDVTVIGSGTVLDYNTDTFASSSGNVNAGGTLDVSADRETNLTTVAGQAALGGTAGIGIAVSFIDKSDSVYAYVGGGTSNVGGLEVSATGNDTLTPVAAGGALSEAVGVAGSAVVNILNETTDAYIGEETPTPGSIPPVNFGASGPTVNAGAGGVSVTSTSNTNLTPSVAGAIGIGIDVGAAAAADVTTITKDTTAEVYYAANVNSTGDVLVGSNSEELADSLGISGAGGVYAGVAVAASVYIINDTTNASIDDGATVKATDSVGVSSNDQTDLDLLEGHISGGIAGIGAALAFADVTKNTNAWVDGSVTAEGNGSAINADNGTFKISYVPFGSGATSYGAQVPNSNSDFSSNLMFTGERRATPNTNKVNGLAVTATSENDYNTVAAGASGGFVGVVANGSILLLNNNTKSEIGTGASIANGTDSVLVAAGTDVGHIGSALGVAGGFVGAGAGFDVSIISNNTTADITNAFVDVNGNVAVNANAGEDVVSLVAGVSGGFVGATGSVSVSELNDKTKAYISGNSATAGGNLSVNSNDTTDVLLLVGAVGGGAVGVGGSVAVDLVTKDTEAYIDNGTSTMAGGSTKVAANSSEQLSDGTIAGGGGVFAGAAGAVSVESDNSSTSATVGTGADTAGNGLTVSAQNTANATSFVGTVGGALFGATAGSVDVGNIENPTSAEIVGANVNTTGGDVDVSATETRNINSQAISGGTAIGAIQASVIDWGVSAGVNTSGAGLTTSNPLDGSSYGGGSGTVYNGADNQSNSAASQGSGMLGEFGGGSAGTQAAKGNSDLVASTGGTPVSNAVTEAPPAKGTTAEIDGGSVTSAGAVNVTSSDTTNMKLSAGGASVSAIGVGAAVDIASVNTSSTAEIIGGSQVSANGNVVVDAGRTDNVNGQALDGQLGFAFGGGAAVTVVTDKGTTDAETDATVSQTSCLQVTASTMRDDSATSGQVSVGTVGAGYSYASVNEVGNTTAQIDGGSMTLPAVQSVQVSADDNSAASASSTAISAGIISIGGGEADTTINPTVDAHIAGGTTVDTAAPTQTNPSAGDVQVLASAEEEAYSNTTGVNAGAASIGVGSIAQATSSPKIDAYINGTVNAGGDVTVAARYNYNSSDQPMSAPCDNLGINTCSDLAAQATGSAGSLFANVGNGAQAYATTSPSVSAYLNGATVTSAGTVSIHSDSGSSVYTDADSSSGTLGVSLSGDTNAISQISNENSAYVQSSTVKSNNFLLSAQSTDDAVGANASGSSLGLLAGVGTTNANSAVGGTTEAQLGGTTTINAKNDASILATVSEQASANANESSGGLGGAANTLAAVGNVNLASDSYSSVDTPQVVVPAGTTINANTSTVEADLAQALFSASANTNVYAGYGESNSTAWVFVPDDPTVYVQGNIAALQKLSIIATVNNNSSDVKTYGYANAHTTGVTGPGSTGTDDNTTDFEPSVTVGPGTTLTTDNLYIEATTPVPPSGSNPYWSNYANGTSDCICPPGSSNSEGQYTFGPGTGITLNATIIEPGTANPSLMVDASGNETGNVTAPESEDDIVVPNLINTNTASITLNTPSGFTAGASTVHDDTSWSTVTIINKSSYDLVINSIQPFSDSGAPTVSVVSDPSRNNEVFTFTSDNTTPQITIENTSPTAVTDIYLNGAITDPTGSVTMSALLGSILPLSSSNETEATTISLTANHGNIGMSGDPLNLSLVPVEGLTETAAPAVPATLDILAGQNLYASLTALEFFRPGDSVPPITNVPANLYSIEAGDAIDLNLNPGIAEIPTLETVFLNCCSGATTTMYVDVPHTVNGVYNVTHDITAGGDVLVNAPALTTLNMDTGSTITSGFASLGFTVNSGGTYSSTPIFVNYSNTIDNNNVVMQSLQQQGGNFTIAGSGALTGTGTINVLNGYTNVNITNNSNANLVMNNLSFDTPVTGTVSIFGTSESLSGTYTAGGANISLTKTNNTTSTITISENGTSGNIDLGGSINNMSGLTTISSANGNIVNTGGSSELVESNFITLNAANGAVGSSGTPINVQVDNGYINSAAKNDIALDQVTGNLLAGSISSTAGNVYLTSAGSILDGNGSSSLVSGGNITLDAIAGAIGTSSSALLIDATGNLTGQAQTGAYITQTTGPMNVNNVTSNTGNITLSASNGNVNLGTNSVDALAPNTSTASVVTINANGNINDSSTSTAISGDTIVLNSTSTTGNIGSPGNPIEVRNSLNAPGVVSGSTINGNMYVNETVGAMNVGTITSTGGTVNLSTTSGPILNGDGILGMPANVNVTAPNINLTSNGSTIGTSLNALDVNNTSSTGGLNATAPGDIYITDTVGNLYLNSVTSTTAGNVGLSTTVGNVDLDNASGTVNDLNGNTTITANGNILNVAGTAASINTQGITLNATNGSIGTSATPLRVHSNAGPVLVTPATVQALANLGIYLTETTGPLYVSSFTSATSDIYIISDGSIFNGNSSSTAVDLTGNNINLTSNNGGIGSASRMLIVNNRNGTNTVSATATTTPTGHSLDMYANGATNGSIYVEENSGDLISSNMIESKTGNVDLLVNNGSAWINAINVSPFGNPATTNLGPTQNKTVTVLVQGNVLNANTISSPDSLTMTVNPGTSWTTTPGTDTIRVGQADVFSTVTAQADNVNMPLVYALNQGSLTNDISRQTEGLHFFVSGWGNPGGYNYLANLASNVNINVSPCPIGCSTIPAVVFNNLTTNNATVTAGEEWLELVNAIIGTQGAFTTPYQSTTLTWKSPQQQGATRYTPFYFFNFGTYQKTDANSSYWVSKEKILHSYTLTQQLNTIFNDLLKYYGLP